MTTNKRLEQAIDKWCKLNHFNRDTIAANFLGRLSVLTGDATKPVDGDDVAVQLERAIATEGGDK